MRAVFASKPHPLVESSPHVVVVLLEEARWPVGVTSTGKWVIVPPVEEDGGGFGDVGDVGVHRVEDVHQFRLNLGIGQRFDTFRPIALWVIVVRMARKWKKTDVQ